MVFFKGPTHLLLCTARASDAGKLILIDQWTGFSSANGLVICKSNTEDEKSSHMQIPSFVPKITRGVVGSFSSSSYHLGFVYVCVCTGAGNNASFPQSARHGHPPPTSPTLAHSLNRGWGEDFRWNEKAQCLPSCLPACLPKREREKKSAELQAETQETGDDGNSFAKDSVVCGSSVFKPVCGSP